MHKIVTDTKTMVRPAVCSDCIVGVSHNWEISYFIYACCQEDAEKDEGIYLVTWFNYCPMCGKELS